MFSEPSTGLAPPTPSNLSFYVPSPKYYLSGTIGRFLRSKRIAENTSSGVRSLRIGNEGWTWCQLFFGSIAWTQPYETTEVAEK